MPSLLFCPFSGGVGTCNSKIPHGNVMDNCQESCLYYCDLGYEATVSLHSLKCSLNNTWVPKWENRHVSEEELCRRKFLSFFLSYADPLNNSKICVVVSSDIRSIQILLTTRKYV